MTGYGRSNQNVDGYEISIEIRSVNHRYLECSFRLPKGYQYLEEKLRSLLQSYLSRGKVELTLLIMKDDSISRKISVDMPLAEAYLTSLRKANEEFGLEDDLTLSKLLTLQGIFLPEKEESLSEAHFWQAIKLVATQAIDELCEMREKEGKSLVNDISGRLKEMENLLAQIEGRVPKMLDQYEKRLYARLKELKELKEYDSARILTECALFADRVDTHEEIARLKSHIGQLSHLLTEDSPVGRKMDFLIQEMNREVNTIGSKSQDLEISRLVIEMKSEVEKMREQVQNIE